VLEEHIALDSRPSTLDRIYTYGHTLISQDRVQGANWFTSFYGYDGHNNVRYLTDLNGLVTDTYDYDAFGNLISRTGDTPNNYLFTGEQYDPDLGLYYLRARYHNTDTGRFWTQDSYEGFGEDPSSLHKYTYCGNNPIGASDPSGNLSLTEVMGAQTIGLTVRFSFATMVGTISGAFATLDAEIASNFQATPAQLAQAAAIGFGTGFVFGFAATYAPATVTAIGMGIGGYQVISTALQGNVALTIFRATAFCFGLGLAKTPTGAGLMAALFDSINGTRIGRLGGEIVSLMQLSKMKTWLQSEHGVTLKVEPVP